MSVVLQLSDVAAAKVRDRGDDQAVPEVSGHGRGRRRRQRRLHDTG